ncbi:MAG: nicotinamide riboside transporter PnuC [Bacteroidota bacterium]
MEEISIYHSILRSALALGWVQWLAFIFSLIYVFLAARESIWCWFFGLIGVLLAAKVYVDYRLYSEALLQIYYALISLYGWWAWINSRRPKSEVEDPLKSSILDEGKWEEMAPDLEDGLSIGVWTKEQHIRAFLLGTALGLVWGYFWSHFGAAMPYIDACITSFSVIATYMVARKILENWLYWIAIDFVCIFVYLDRGMYLFAILFLVYCIVAVFGYFNWKREMMEG